eukprot:1370726-Amorphochlora_amoeboformis.AAC.1
MSDNLNVKCTRRTYEVGFTLEEKGIPEPVAPKLDLELCSLTTSNSKGVGSEEDWEMKISSYRGRGSRMAREPHHRVQASDLEDLLNADNPGMSASSKNM